MSQSHSNGNPLLPYTETILPSGMTLVHKEVNSAPIVAIDIWIHTGTIHDPEPHEGLSHFYEHMFFKGTQKYGVGVMDRIITELGGYNNAATSYDYTHYYVVLPSAGWKQALDVMIDSLQNPLFPDKEIESERNVIIEEIKRHEDSHWSKLYENFTDSAFAQTPYQRKILGTVDSLHTINGDTFREYLASQYQPGNITLCVVGNVTQKEVTDQLNELLAPNGKVRTDQEKSSYEIINSPAEVVITRDINQSYLLIGFPTPRLIGTSHEFGFDLLSSILGDGRSSRLHRRLHDELGLVSSINASYWSMVHAGLFVIDAVTDPSNVERVEQEINNELNRVRDTLKPEELNKVKNMARADYSFANEKAISIAGSYGYSRVAATIEHSINYLENMNAIGIDDLTQTFDQYLIPSRRCKAVLLPKSG